MAIASRRARKRRRRPSLNSLPARWTKRLSANSCAPTRSGRERIVEGEAERRASITRLHVSRTGRATPRCAGDGARNIDGELLMRTRRRIDKKIKVDADGIHSRRSNDARCEKES